MDPRKKRRSPRTRSVVAATGLLLLGIAPFGVAATGDALREGQRNGTANRETQIISNAAEAGRSTGGYATRQSNLSRSGGGAIYGCRSTGATRTNPCLRSNNLSTGSAFEFNTVGGETGTAPCGATFVTCAPPGTEDNEVLVVAPRQSDGAATAAGARLRFYVYVTGSQAG